MTALVVALAVSVLACIPAAAWVRGHLREARELSPRAWRAGHVERTDS